MFRKLEWSIYMHVHLIYSYRALVLMSEIRSLISTMAATEIFTLNDCTDFEGRKYN